MTDLLSAASKRSSEWVGLVGTLVDIDSGRGDREVIAPVCDVMDRELTRLVFGTKRSTTAGPNVTVAHRPSKMSGAPRLGLIGHADTVFGKGTRVESPIGTEAGRMLGPGAVGAVYHTVDEFVVSSSVPERVATFAELLGDIAIEGL
jgi:glutamate carboxypeptidase